MDAGGRRYLEQAGRVWIWLDGTWIVATPEETAVALAALKVP